MRSFSSNTTCTTPLASLHACNCTMHTPCSGDVLTTIKPPASVLRRCVDINTPLPPLWPLCSGDVLMTIKAAAAAMHDHDRLMKTAFKGIGSFPMDKIVALRAQHQV